MQKMLRFHNKPNTRTKRRHAMQIIGTEISLLVHSSSSVCTDDCLVAWAGGDLTIP